MPTAQTELPHTLVRFAIRWWPLVAALVVASLAGRATWFLCDDAFITFRFCGNAYDGHGFVWNAAPFAPVEGYTSFLWLWLLYVAWLVTGSPPTVLAAPFSLVCGLLVLVAIARRLQAWPLPEGQERWRAPLAATVLCGTASNHTFATWLSSGLETAMFGLWAVLWTLTAVAREGVHGKRLARLMLWASLAVLTRPDGILLVFGTVAIAAHAVMVQRRTWRSALLCLWPLSLPLLHLLWRRTFYGEWLPNTYYAKITTAWPESGLRYLLCFALEHGLWLLLPLALAWLVVGACRGAVLRALATTRFAALTAVGVWLGYTGYYTLVVGGDHFAYRIFAHFIPLLFLAAAFCARSLRLPIAWLAVGLGVFALCANVPGWWLERQLIGREGEGYARVVGRAPSWLHPVAALYDRHQAWLLLHSVGHRRALHALSCERALADLSQRARGQIAGSVPGQRLVLRADAIGVVGWSLPDVAIIDGHGLCDWVIARSPKPPATTTLMPAELKAAFGALDLDRDGRLGSAEIAASVPMLVSVGPQLQPGTWVELMLSLGDADGDEHLVADELVAAVMAIVPPRQMAHERAPPPGYIEAMRPNVTSAPGPDAPAGGRRVMADVVPLSDAEVRAVEARFRAEVRR